MSNLTNDPRYRSQYTLNKEISRLEKENEELVNEVESLKNEVSQLRRKVDEYSWQEAAFNGHIHGMY